MKSKKLKYRNGFTLTELMVTLLIALLVLAGIGVAMVDSIRSFPTSNERAQGAVVTDGYVAKAAFDRICRNASAARVETDLNGTYLRVYYYNSPTSPSLDRYALFYRSDTSLNVEYGTCNVKVTPEARTATGIETILTTIDPVKPPKFAINGANVLMILNLKKDNQTMTVPCTAYRHNL